MNKILSLTSSKMRDRRVNKLSQGGMIHAIGVMWKKEQEKKKKEGAQDCEEGSYKMAA